MPAGMESPLGLGLARCIGRHTLAHFTPPFCMHLVPRNIKLHMAFQSQMLLDGGPGGMAQISVVSCSPVSITCRAPGDRTLAARLCRGTPQPSCPRGNPAMGTCVSTTRLESAVLDPSLVSVCLRRKTGVGLSRQRMASPATQPTVLARPGGPWIPASRLTPSADASQPELPLPLFA